MCRISNVCYCSLQAGAVKKFKTNIRNSKIQQVQIADQAYVD
jgi:hypothetical protein